MIDVTASHRRGARAALGWFVAVASVPAAHGMNLAIPNGIFPAPFFVLAVMLTVHIGGSWPGALSFVLASATLDYFYVPPFHSWAIRTEVLLSLSQFVSPVLLGWWFIQKRKDVELLLERETSVAKCLQGEKSFAEIGQALLGYLAPELGAPIAALYSVEQDGTARRCAGYAFDIQSAPEVFPPGQGAVGQAVIDGHTKVLGVPPDYVSVRSGLGARRPRSVVIAPSRDDRQTHAVLELGFFRGVDRPTLLLLERISEPLAVAFRTAAYRTRLQDLLEETRRQAEELKAHEEGLRVANEELEERGRVMLGTQRKLEEQQHELEATNQTLQSQARLLELSNEELGQAHEAVRAKSESAERANRAKSEFLANMSHELRTPLNSSLILSKLLSENKEGNLSEQQVRSAETIYSAGNDLLAMIDDILDLAKIEAGKLDVRVEDVSLARLRDNLLRVFEPVAQERGLRFVASIAPGAPETLRTDGQRLAQIVKNLLSNALKFTEHGEVSLLLGGDPVSCQFVVKDTGIGIPGAALEGIFEAFRQADGNTNRKYGGTGLGLSISRELAQLLGGDITVASEPGAGSSFTLTLPTTFDATPLPVRDGARATSAGPAINGRPLHDGVSVYAGGGYASAQPSGSRASLGRGHGGRAAPARGAPGASAVLGASTALGAPTALGAQVVPSPVPAAATNGRAILVIEDDPYFARIVADLAREMDFHATVVSTADEAVHHAVEHPPKGIVLDMKLPDHSGLSVLDRLKRDPRTRHIPVHIISLLDHTRTALEMGAVGYLLKPVQREQIQGALRKLESEFTRRVRRLLVVEDDLVQREAICQLFRTESVEIIAVGTVKEALEQLRTSELDCVVTDLALPDASGYDLLETMAQDDAYTFPSVVVYTGRSLSPEDEDRLRKYSSSIIVKGVRSPERLLDEVTLFLHQVESTLPPERQRMLRSARDREAVFEGRTVLIVEDDVRNIFALSSALEPKGMKIKVARNGREALEALELKPDFDVVLMDIMMPEMDGLEATRAIRSQPRWAKLPIIALTAKAMKDDQERCLQAGANDYVPKPLDVEVLLSLLRIWMTR